ncbi:NUDIX hydrolase [Paenibacillus sp. ACRRX]|uniref:NUDIX hydrolase n=1 Tax=unclassified Paenibacillus TaxID=185978 RepID=UPI001EF44CCF|nr:MULTISPECIES: NUDIX hydrolase [unclassified Paenibacillus]MCG7407579.1 NUDIX hydrolase [Paenibacillus sp. ACRRX]MDK8180814.1 NUDIX hydrolase [Paenibacillus sp. UMB4589-SE434]
MPDSKQWLLWARQLQAISQNGLAYSKDPFDVERFEQIRHISAAIAASHTDTDAEQLVQLWSGEQGYATPKVDVRAVILHEDKLLLVRENSDNRWALPGGWADRGLSAAENVVKEVYEEAGFQVEAVRLLAVLDKHKHEHPLGWNDVYKLFFQCTITGGSAAQGMETSEVAFFRIGEWPELSESRNTAQQLDRVCRLAVSTDLGVWFD